MEIECSEYSLGGKTNLTEEEKLWIERIERYPLWYRYMPKHVQKNELVWDYYAGHWNFSGMYEKLFGKNKSDKRTRNEIGQEKHESRKCSECGK